MVEKSLRPELEERFSQYCYTFESLGFVRIPKFLSVDKVKKANEIIDVWIEAFCKKNGRTPTKFPFLELDPLFMEIMSDPFIMQICSRYLGEWFRFDHAIGLSQPTKACKRDGSWVESQAVNLHGGPFCSQGSCFVYQTPEGKIWMGQLNVGIVLTEQTGKDGGFCYVPGTHFSPNGLQGHEVLQNFLKNDFNDPMITVPHLEPGDLVVFTEAIVHGMAPWKSAGSVRRNIYYKYSPGFLAWRNYEDIKKYLPLAKTSIQKHLLRPPFVASYQEDYAVEENNFRAPTLTEQEGILSKLIKKISY